MLTGFLQSQGLKNQYDFFTESQKEVLNFAYDYGRDHDLSYSLAAIAWQESQAGLFLIDFQGQTAGIWHVSVDGVINRNQKMYKDTPFIRNLVAQKLMNNRKFCAKEAVKELLYWKNKRSNWVDIWASYNGGYNYESRQAQRYAREVAEKIKFLKKYHFNQQKEKNGKTN